MCKLIVIFVLCHSIFISPASWASMCVLSRMLPCWLLSEFWAGPRWTIDLVPSRLDGLLQEFDNACRRTRMWHKSLERETMIFTNSLLLAEISGWQEVQPFTESSRVSSAFSFQKLQLVNFGSFNFSKTAGGSQSFTKVGSNLPLTWSNTIYK